MIDVNLKLVIKSEANKYSETVNWENTKKTVKLYSVSIHIDTDRKIESMGEFRWWRVWGKSNFGRVATDIQQGSIEYENFLKKTCGVQETH